MGDDDRPAIVPVDERLDDRSRVRHASRVESHWVQRARIDSPAKEPPDAMSLEKPPVAVARMLVRKPVSEVFEAFIDPAVGTDDEKVARALDTSGGFHLVLAACKAWLEHGIELNVVADHDPDSVRR